MSIDYAFSVLDAASGNVGLFTGRLEMNAEGHLVPEIIYRSPSEAEALAHCYRVPGVGTAARVSGMLLAFGPPALDVQLVEIRRVGP